jgi:hypothetical protein
MYNSSAEFSSDTSSELCGVSGLFVSVVFGELLDSSSIS